MVGSGLTGLSSGPIARQVHSYKKGSPSSWTAALLYRKLGLSIKPGDDGRSAGHLWPASVGSQVPERPLASVVQM